MASSSNRRKVGRGATLKSQSRELVYNLRCYFEEERDNGGPLLPLSKVVERVAAALKIGATSVIKITKEKCAGDPQVPTAAALSTPGKTRVRAAKTTDLDNFQEDAIRRHIYEYYTRKEYPTRKKLLVSLRNSELFFGGKTSLSCVLNKIGFQWKTFSGRRVLLERGDIVAWRCRFLREICKCMPNEIVWVDETWVNARHSRTIAWTDDSARGTMKAPVGKGSRLILLHAGTINGFVPNALLLFSSKKSGDYHEEMTATKFKEWFVHSLLPNIEKNSTIIMDNASYHSVQLNKAPTCSSRKNDIVDWLQKNNIHSFDKDMKKAELLEIVKEHKSRKIIYEIDTIAEENGHRVLRLPPYHCQFNAIELVWAQVKAYVAEKNKSFTLKGVELLLREALDSITPPKWNNVVTHTWRILEEAWQREGALEEQVDELIIRLGDDSSSSSSSGDEDSDSDVGDAVDDDTLFQDCGVHPLP